MFEILSGLHINMLKSIVYPVNDVQNLESLADILCLRLRLDKIRRNFLWEGNNKTTQIPSAEVAKMTLPKHLGGLGIKNLDAHNKCLLMKWLRRFDMEEQVLWKDVVSAKHGIQSHWYAKVSIAPFGVGPWKNIAKLWEEFSQHCNYQAGNGIHIKFLKNRWLGNITLENDYPNLFLISSNPNSTISQDRDNNNWAPIFGRNFQD
ncbi:unnamed protein product [Withania somnifera]